MIKNYQQKLIKLPIKGYDFHIDLNSNKTIKTKPYIIPLKFETKFKEELKKLVKDGVISRSKSNFASPCYAKLKPNGSLRLLVDFRKLNSITIPYNDFFPSSMDELHKFKGKKIFSTMDMKSGYYQLNIAEPDRYKTAIITQFGKYEFNRVPFGLMNAPKVFNSMMREIFSDIPDVQVFVDDIIIASTDEKSHLNTLQHVFNKLLEMNINLNIDKCKFFVKEVFYLGFIITEKGICVNKNKVKDFKMWPIPTTRRKLQKNAWYH